MNEDRNVPVSLSPLSADGERRRAQILTEAVGLGRRLRRRRAIRRVAAVIAVPAIAIGVLFAVVPQHQAESPLAKRSTAQSPSIQPTPALPSAPTGSRSNTVVAAALPTSVIEIVQATPSVTARYLADAPAVSFVQRVDDDDLLRSIDDAGMNGGLATIGTNTVLYVDGNALR